MFLETNEEIGAFAVFSLPFQTISAHSGNDWFVPISIFYVLLITDIKNAKQRYKIKHWYILDKIE